MARLKPTSLAAFQDIKGIGSTKLNTLCPAFRDAIVAYELKSGLTAPEDVYDVAFI